jgi:hypothetical protein
MIPLWQQALDARREEQVQRTVKKRAQSRARMQRLRERRREPNHYGART